EGLVDGVAVALDDGSPQPLARATLCTKPARRAERLLQVVDRGEGDVQYQVMAVAAAEGSRLLERESVFGDLRNALSGAGAGRGRVVLVAGEGGGGKAPPVPPLVAVRPAST